jgi:hypothetical protein
VLYRAELHSDFFWLLLTQENDSLHYSVLVLPQRVAKIVFCVLLQKKISLLIHAEISHKIANAIVTFAPACGGILY